MTRKIAVFTGTRADYGLLYWLMKDIASDPDLDLMVIVGGMHLMAEFGETWKEVAAQFDISTRVDLRQEGDNPGDIARATGRGVVAGADALETLQPDALVVLGDRFEALAMAQAALFLGIPIAHIHGGEVTEGAIDDALRHAITKMASLHFTAAEPYRQRVIQMGEDPALVLNVGAVGLDHLHRGMLMKRTEVLSALKLGNDPYFLATYHPETAGGMEPEDGIRAMLDAMRSFDDHNIVVTYPNADAGGLSIIRAIEKSALEHPQRVRAVKSLGQTLYLGAAAGAAAVVGNSSSALIEVPSLGVPAVNIGARQSGRLTAPGVINCGDGETEIGRALKRAISDEFTTLAQKRENPYNKGDAAAAIVMRLKGDLPGPSKRFHDLEFKR